VQNSRLDVDSQNMAAPLILGINAYHADAAACIVRDGKLLAAAEEERFRRIKHWAGFPSQAIQYCLREANVELADVTHVAVNRNSRANLLRKLHYVAFHQPSVRLLLKRLRNRQQMAGIADELRMLSGRPFAGKIEDVEHHLAHLASAFFASPFDEAVVVSVDGFGDFASAAWGCGQGVTLSLDGRVLFPHSLGGGSFAGFSRLKRELDAVVTEMNDGAPIESWRLHDLRRSSASALQRLGVQLPVTECVLNHTSGSFAGVVGIYQTEKYESEQRDALERLALHLTKLQADNVIDLSARRA